VVLYRRKGKGKEKKPHSSPNSVTSEGKKATPLKSLRLKIKRSYLSVLRVGKKGVGDD